MSRDEGDKGRPRPSGPLRFPAPAEDLRPLRERLGASPPPSDRAGPPAGSSGGPRPIGRPAGGDRLRRAPGGGARQAGPRNLPAAANRTPPIVGQERGAGSSRGGVDGRSRSPAGGPRPGRGRGGGGGPEPGGSGSPGGGGATRGGGAGDSGRGSAKPGGRAVRSASRRPRLGVLIAVVVAAAAGIVALRHLRAQPAAATSRNGHGAHLGGAPKHHGPPPRTIGLASCTFVDRAPGVVTHNYYTGASTPGRTLVTEIRYPTLHGARGRETPRAAPDRSGGPWPLVLFAGGYDTDPSTYQKLLDAWVNDGFVVASPIFPDTSIAGVIANHNDSEGDDEFQPGDVAFVTRQLLAADAGRSTTCPVMRDLVRTSAIGLAGQSDGGETVAALAYGSAYRALTAGIPYRAVVSMSGQGLFVPPGNSYSADPSDAFLVTQSNADACNPPQYSVDLYSAVVQPDRWFLEMFGVHHLPPYNGAAPRTFAVVVKVTEAFLHAELAGRAPGGPFLSLGNATPSIAKLTTGPPPAMPTLHQSSAACYLQH